MNFVDNPAEMLALASSILLLLLCSNRALVVASCGDTEKDKNDVDELLHLWQNAASSSMDLKAMTRASLHSLQLLSSVRILEDDLDYWVKPRSTTWFSRFLIEQYDEARWLKMFRFSKPSVFPLAELLKPLIEKKDTKYRLAIPVVVRVACTLFKLTHGASLLICSEMFAVGRDSRYPLMSWLMILHREHEQVALANSLFNRKLRRGRGVVENAFGLLKQSFRELLLKTDLDVTFVPDMVMCCALLHNLLQKQSTEDVETLLNVLREEGYNEDVDMALPAAAAAVAPALDEFPQ